MMRRWGPMRGDRPVRAVVAVVESQTVAEMSVLLAILLGGLNSRRKNDENRQYCRPLKCVQM